MSTNTQTEYQKSKARHKATLAKARKVVDQQRVLASHALEEAALEFMRTCPGLNRCEAITEYGIVFFHEGKKLSVWMEKPYGPPRVVARVRAFEREFFGAYSAIFGRPFPVFRIDRDATGALTLRREW